jgi:hypothetical protein
MRVSNSKVGTWRRCPKKYWFKYELGITPKVKGVALERGSWMHSLLEAHYGGKSWKAEHKRLSKTFYNLFDEQREELGDLPGDCLRLMRSYLRHYPDDLSRYTVVDVEVDEIVTLPNGLKFQLIIDLVVEDQRGRLWLWDHKFRKNFGASEGMALDPQLTRYYWGAEKLGYTDLAGIIYNEIGTKPPTVPKLLKAGGLSKAKNIATDTYTYMDTIRQEGLDPTDYTEILAHIAVTQKDKFFKRTALPKDPPMLKQMMQELVWSAQEIQLATKKGHFPRTYIANDCKWSCEYKDMCIASLHGADIEPMIKRGFETRDQRKKREARERRKGIKRRPKAEV